MELCTHERALLIIISIFFSFQNKLIYDHEKVKHQDSLYYRDYQQRCPPQLE